MMFGELTEEAGLPVCQDEDTSGKNMGGGPTNGISAQALR
jgi:hypothetical protein